MSEHGIDGVYICIYGILQHGNTCNRLNNEHDNKLQCMELFFLSFQGMLGPGHGRFQQKNIEFYQWVVSKKVDTTRWKFRRKKYHQPWNSRAHKFQTRAQSQCRRTNCISKRPWLKGCFAASSTVRRSLLSVHLNTTKIESTTGSWSNFFPEATWVTCHHRIVVWQMLDSSL